MVEYVCSSFCDASINLSGFVVQILRYGMDEEVGQVAFDMPNRGELVGDKPYSEATAEIVDKRARRLIDKSYDLAKKTIMDNHDKLVKVR